VSWDRIAGDKATVSFRNERGALRGTYRNYSEILWELKSASRYARDICMSQLHSAAGSDHRWGGLGSLAWPKIVSVRLHVRLIRYGEASLGLRSSRREARSYVEVWNTWGSVGCKIDGGPPVL
jgi:hypothetical protein